MGKTLLVGNGPNRLDGSRVSWAQVMEELSGEEPRDADRFSVDKPLPLLFEELALARDRRGLDGRAELKQAFAESINRLRPNAIHELIMSHGFADVLTTNYDYSLELAFDGTMPERQESDLQLPETKYSIFRHRTSGPTRVWHIHGEASQPNSLQLGYEHYGSGLSKIEQFTGAGHRGQRSRYSPSASEWSDSPESVSWVDVFLRDDIHIVGLSLDFVEVDLWWLLVLKERLRSTGKKRVGRTFFHALAPPADDTETQRLMATLRGLGVQVTTAARAQGYEGFYRQTILDVAGRSA